MEIFSVEAVRKNLDVIILCSLVEPNESDGKPEFNIGKPDMIIYSSSKDFANFESYHNEVVKVFNTINDWLEKHEAGDYKFKAS